MMESLKMIFSLLCVSGCLQLTLGVATSHQSIVSGEGWRYSYGIVHGPHGHGHVTGESYPHGYGGFGSYAPTYGYEGYGVGIHDPHHHDLHHDLHQDLHHDLHHVLPVPAVHAPIPVVHAPLPIHADHFPDLPVHLALKPELLTPIKAIHPLPHVVPVAKPYAALPSYAGSYHDYGSYLGGDHNGDYLGGHIALTSGYGSGYGGGYESGYGGGYGSGYGGGYGSSYGKGYLGELSYGDLLSHYYDDDHLLHDYHNYEDLLSDHGHKPVYSSYVGDNYKGLYKPNYNDYYGSTSYHH